MQYLLVLDPSSIYLYLQLPKKQFRYASEFTSRAELEALALDLDSLRLQSLIICERILGTQHKVSHLHCIASMLSSWSYRIWSIGWCIEELLMRTVFNIITALVGHIYVMDNSKVLTKSIVLWVLEKIFTLFSPDLWKYALELRIAKDTILYCDTCFTAQATNVYYTLHIHEFLKMFDSTLACAKKKIGFRLLSVEGSFRMAIQGRMQNFKFIDP